MHSRLYRLTRRLTLAGASARLQGGIQTRGVLKELLDSYIVPPEDPEPLWGGLIKIFVKERV